MGQLASETTHFPGLLPKPCTWIVSIGLRLCLGALVFPALFKQRKKERTTPICVGSKKVQPTALSPASAAERPCPGYWARLRVARSASRRCEQSGHHFPGKASTLTLLPLYQSHNSPMCSCAPADAPLLPPCCSLAAPLLQSPCCHALAASLLLPCCSLAFPLPFPCFSLAIPLLSPCCTPFL